MQQYNMLQAIFMSFYSRKLYQDVANQWGGKVFLYLLLVLALSWLFPVYQLQQSFSLMVNQLSNKIVSQIPVMTIKDGKLITPENRPYIITDPDSHVNMAIIDTSGKYTNLQQLKTGILITKTEIISQPHPNEFKVDEIPKDLTFTLVPQTVQQYLQKYVGYSWMLMFIAFLLFSFASICTSIFKLFINKP